MTVFVFSTPSCYRCKELMSWLKAYEIAFSEMNLQDPEVITELRTKNIFTLEAPGLLIDNLYLSSNVLFKGDELQTEILKCAFEDQILYSEV